ncbi:MAG: hypothetical protein M3R27_09085 [Bacteroidota bacterium]|nr:hypothetical protein [Bacteroidota bacterium]
MKNLLLFSFLILSLFSCSTQTTTESTTETDSLNAIPTPTEFKGLFSNGKFIWCENPRIIFLVQDESNSLDSLYKVAMPGAYSKQTAYIEVRGEMPDNKSKDLLIVKEVLKIEQKNARNTCVPYDYWCSGNEPFWQVQISQSEDLIDIYYPMENRTEHFTYKAPVADQEKFTYSVQNDSSSLFLIIKNEFCTDGMSEKKYNFSAEVLHNGKKLKGCAIKYGEPVQ